MKRVGVALSVVARTLLMGIWIVILFYVLNAVLMTFLLRIGLTFGMVGAISAVLIGVFADRYYRRWSFPAGAALASLALTLPQPHFVTWVLLLLAFCAGFFLPRVWRR